MDCDSSNIYQFLSLLKQPEEMRERDHFQSITSEEWTTVVLRVKKRSASSIYSLRNYAIYKCTLSSTRMTNVLVAYYNLIIQRQFYPSRWLKTLDVILEKNKGPIVDKLRII